MSPKGSRVGENDRPPFGGAGSYVAHGSYVILEALSRYKLTTSELREEIGHDPHPVLGRLQARGVVLLLQDGFWMLTVLGLALLRVGRLERNRHI